MLSLVLAVVDAAVGAYLIRYTVGREPRDKGAVLAAGISGRLRQEVSEPGRAPRTGPAEAPYVPAPEVFVVHVTAHGGATTGNARGPHRRGVSPAPPDL